MVSVTRAELKGISVIELIVLYLNRLNDMELEKEQIKLLKVTRKEDGNVEVIIGPAEGTGWQNGPITFLAPPVQVGEVYAEAVELDYGIVGEKTLTQILEELDMPPCPPSTVAVEHFDFLAGGPYLDLSYKLSYTNAFFVGDVVVKVNNAPNSLDSLRILNQLFLPT